MKIALLHYAAPPVVGGVESVIGHHARLMAEYGHQVRILAGRGEQTDPRVQFVRLPLADSRHPEVEAVKAELDAGQVTPRFSALVEQTRQELLNALEGVNILVAHNVCSLNKNLALTTALWQLYQFPEAPKLVLWHHDLSWTTPRYQPELHVGFPWDLLRQDWPGVTQVVVSEARQKELAELLGISPQRIQVMPNGVDAPTFFKLGEQARWFERELDLLAADPLLLLPVRITPRKNIELALETLAELRRTYPAAKLVVTGPLGPHNPANRDYFKKLAALRAGLGLKGSAFFLAEHTPEYLLDEVIADLYRLADALLLPSREEGFGIPLLEAGLAGLPVFCADIPPLRALGEGYASFFSPDAHAQEVAKLVSERLSADPESGFRRKVKREFTWSSIYNLHIAPLLDALAK